MKPSAPRTRLLTSCLFIKVAKISTSSERLDIKPVTCDVLIVAHSLHPETTGELAGMWVKNVRMFHGIPDPPKLTFNIYSIHSVSLPHDLTLLLRLG